MIYCGIDPGVSGGIAAIIDGNGVAWKMGETEKEIYGIFLEIPQPAFALIERAQAYPKQGISSSFKYGTNYGFLRGCLIGCGIAFEEVSPAKWQSVMRCLSHGDKRITRAKAQQLFPQLKITHHTADALLICEFARRKYAQYSNHGKILGQSFEDF